MLQPVRFQIFPDELVQRIIDRGICDSQRPCLFCINAEGIENFLWISVTFMGKSMRAYTWLIA